MKIEEIRAIKDLAIKNKEFNVNFAKKHNAKTALLQANGAIQFASEIIQMEFNNRMFNELNTPYSKEENAEIIEIISFLENEAVKALNIKIYE